MKRIKHTAYITNQHLNILILVVALSVGLTSCEKWVQVKGVKDKLLAEQVFENEVTANLAISGIYSSLKSALVTVTTIQNSNSSGDILPYSNPLGNDYYTNKLLPNNLQLPWNSLYSTIYAANNAIEKLAISNSLSVNARNYYMAEAKFMRAYCFFHLVNLFGDVPLVITTDVKVNSSIDRNSVAQVYEQIIADLKDAQANMGSNYNYTGGERTRANKWVATALLARAYLYTKDYINSEIQATEVINAGLYTLLNTPNGIFAKNNTEAILQYANTATEANSVASNFIYGSAPVYVCTTSLLHAFEPADLRRTVWVRTQTYASQPVTFPYKFTSTAINPGEYFTAIRLAEMYLIRAEARAMQNGFQLAIDDVNLIRQKHGGLNIPLPAPASQTAATDIILNERRVELFTEGMHRWFDLKRTGRIDAVMLIEKPTTWESYAALYPIPLNDLQRNPNLKPNPGYE
jgi:hypothetical protein